MTKSLGKTKVHLITDFKEPVMLHWALSKQRAGEWLVIFSNLLIINFVYRKMLDIQVIIRVCSMSIMASFCAVLR